MVIPIPEAIFTSQETIADDTEYAFVKLYNGPNPIPEPSTATLVLVAVGFFCSAGRISRCTR